MNKSKNTGGRRSNFHVRLQPTQLAYLQRLAFKQSLNENKLITAAELARRAIEAHYPLVSLINKSEVVA